MEHEPGRVHLRRVTGIELAAGRPDASTDAARAKDDVGCRTCRRGTDELKQLVEDLKVCWAMYPEWGPDQRWQRQKVGFDLELVGTHLHPKHTPSPGCDECRKVYDALRRIADWILPKEERTSRYLIDAFEGKIAMTPRHGFRPDVTLTIRIVHRDD